jgi:hypothetical protein
MLKRVLTGLAETPVGETACFALPSFYLANLAATPPLRSWLPQQK